MRARVNLGLCALAVVVCLGAQPPAVRVSGQLGHVYDGQWWGTIQTQEKQGFVVGHEDCFVWEGKRTRTKSLAEKELVAALDAFYRKRGNSRLSVPAAIKAIAGVAPWPDHPKPINTGGEVWSEPHWYLDGTWWRGGSEVEHRGYVEGYLACKTDLTSQTFSKPAQAYAKDIDDFYARRARNESDKVGAVLMKLANREKN